MVKISKVISSSFLLSSLCIFQMIITPQPTYAITKDALKFMYQIPPSSCADMGGMALDNKNNLLFGVKSSYYGKNPIDKEFLFRINNYTTTYTSKNLLTKYVGTSLKPPVEPSLAHANGMTYYNDHVYVATMNTNEIVEFDKDFNVIKVYKSAHGTPCIAHYKENQFILFDNKTPTVRTYKIATLDNIDNPIKKFTLNPPPGYSIDKYVFQDIAYHNGYVYIPAYKLEKINGVKVIQDNIVYRQKVDDPQAIAEVIEVNDNSKSPTSKFELESLDFNSLGTAIMSFNVNPGDGAIYQLENFDSYYHK